MNEKAHQQKSELETTMTGFGTGERFCKQGIKKPTDMKIRYREH
jgi:hypothetical protein